MPNKRSRSGDEADELLASSGHERVDAGAPRARRRPGTESTQDKRRRLGVDQQHRTETMRRRGRGTFP